MKKRTFWRGDPAIRLRARQLRHDATPSEQILWKHLQDKQLCSLKFRRQHPVAGFVVDFYCAEHRLVIELDGAVHEQQRERDRQRTEILKCQGYRVLRIKNADIENDIEGVLRRIAATCGESAQNPSPVGHDGRGARGEGL
ncbi:endonuclease domain-containing protein [Candidatus Acetothermia bacterium]|nr:endonuclease domain-containing protein [Candidatus Acetothermia bacterium]MCI2431583.1 endonuclease domain-containing protein [Candidatus Acetothermia bacterium]MCI2435853.1 endonuclease domain-containing protein [Candidatus Acetothermia bacterium]